MGSGGGDVSDIYANVETVDSQWQCQWLLVKHGAPLYGAAEKPKSFMINYTLFNLIIITNFIVISKDFSRIRFK